MIWTLIIIIGLQDGPYVVDVDFTTAPMCSLVADAVSSRSTVDMPISARCFPKA